MSDDRTHPWNQDPDDPSLAAPGPKDLIETTPDPAFAGDADGCLLEPPARDRTVARATEAPAAGVIPGDDQGSKAVALRAREVLATMNQEIRAPMNAMIGMARLLLQTKLDEDQQELVDLIWKSGQATLRLVNDAYESTRADQGQLDLDHIAFDLRVTIEETVSSLTPLAAENGLELECRVHPAVPSRLRGDPGRLRQVLLNLGERAIKTVGRGRIEILVSRLRENDQSVTLRFLMMEQGPTAGDPRQSGATSPTRWEPGSKPGCEAGAGSGSAVVRRLAELMGGRTGIECTSAEGYRYWFDVDLEKQEELESSAAPRLSKVELATKRALIVDALPVVRRALRNRLEVAGCRASEAGDAEEAHAVLRAAVESGDPFHFVLIDRDLPGLDGEELGAMIRADHLLDVACTVMLTTVGRRGDATRARARGFSAFLPKAVGAEELVEALCEVIHQAMVTPPGGTPELVTRYSLAEARRSKTRILLVDDDAVSQVVTQWCLSRLGYRLEIAGTLAEARSAWSSAAFDIVLVDEQLADGDAPALARELRAHEGGDPHAAVIAMFRDEASPARLGWRESGGVDFVVKPVDLVVLTRLVERLTGTGLPAGSAIEDEYVGRPAGGPVQQVQDRLELIMPDVDRILTESEMQATMAAAVSASTGEEAPPVPAEPGMSIEATGPDADPADVTEATPRIPADDWRVDPAPCAEAVVEDRAAAPPRESDELEPVAESVLEEEPTNVAPTPATGLEVEEGIEPRAESPDLDQVPPPPPAAPAGTAEFPTSALVALLPADVVALDATVPEDADERENAAAGTFGGEAATEAPLESALAHEAGPPGPPSAAPDLPAAEWPVEALPQAEAADAPAAGIPTDVPVEPTAADGQVEEPAVAETGSTPPSQSSAVDDAASTPQPLTAGVEADETEAASSSFQEPLRLEVVEGGAAQPPLEPESVGLSSVQEGLLDSFLVEINQFLEKISWALSDADALQVASEARGLVALSRAAGASACADALEELAQRGEEGTLKAADTILRRCYGQGLCAAMEVRAQLAEHRRAA